MPPYEQIQLFNSGLNMRLAEEVKVRIMNAKLAANTLKMYRQSWNIYERWCREAGRTSMPSTPQDCIDYASWAIASGHRLETVYIRLKAINYYHREANLALPCDTSVHQFMLNARRFLCERSQAKAALEPIQLRKISRALGRRNKSVDIRDRAALLLCFALGWRCSELVSLDLKDVSWVPGGILVWLGKSKTDQEGKGRFVAVQHGKRQLTCPLTALEAWLEFRGAWSGPLFTRLTPAGTLTEKRLAPSAVNRIVKNGIHRIGEDPKVFGAHSLRAGMITASLESGATETSVMQRTGHKCRQTLQRYVRPSLVFRANPLRRVL